MSEWKCALSKNHCIYTDGHELCIIFYYIQYTMFQWQFMLSCLLRGRISSFKRPEKEKFCHVADVIGEFYMFVSDSYTTYFSY